MDKQPEDVNRDAFLEGMDTMCAAWEEAVDSWAKGLALISGFLGTSETPAQILVAHIELAAMIHKLRAEVRAVAGDPSHGIASSAFTDIAEHLGLNKDGGLNGDA